MKMSPENERKLKRFYAKVERFHNKGMRYNQYRPIATHYNKWAVKEHKRWERDEARITKLFASHEFTHGEKNFILNLFAIIMHSENSSGNPFYADIIFMNLIKKVKK